MTDWLERAAARRPDAIAVAAPEGALTYAQLLEQVVATPPPATLEEPPGLAFAIGLHACLRAGSPAVPIDARLTGAERAAQRAVAPPPGTALVVHTSGTTGAPQPVFLTADNILANALGSAAVLGLDPRERWLCPLPLSHVGGLMVLLRSAVCATTAVLQPPPFDPARVAEADVTLMSLVPTMLARILDAGCAPPPALRAVLLGGAGAPRRLLERAAAAGWPVRATYGLTQACSQVTVAEPGDARTAGIPLPNMAVRLAPDGEIVIAGPAVAQGGGPLATGDLGRLDERGRLVVIGRKVDTIVTGGENVAPAEVEAVLLAHPFVADAAVLGRPDPEWGEAITALVVARPDTTADAAELRAFCAQRLARHKVPKRFETVRSLPRTSSGKLLRRELR